MGLSHDQENVVKLIHLLDIGRRGVKQIFDREFHPSKLISVMKTKRYYDKLIYLKQRKIITEKQFNNLQDKVTSDQFDVPLMVCLLRHLAELPIGEQFSEIDLSEVADIARIKHYRNFLAHFNDIGLSDDYFQEIWQTVSQAIKRLDNKSRDLSQECDDLENANCLDILNRDTELIIDSFLTETTELGAALRNIRDEFNNIRELSRDPVPPIKRGEIEETLQKWKKKCKKFIDTRASKEILQQIRRNDCVAVTGSFGVGKTDTIQRVSVAMSEEHGFYVIPVKRPVDFQKYYNPERYNLFVVDRFCGHRELNENDVKEWRGQLKHLNERCKLLFSCRSHIYRDERFTSLNELNFFHECNLESPGLRLNLTEKKLIADLYDIKIDDRFISQCKFSCFPLLCKLYAKGNERHPEFLIRPYSVYENLIDMMQATGATGKYCALALLVILNNEIDESLLINIDRAGSDILYYLRKTCDECNFSTTNANVNICKELHTLLGTFVEKKKSIYKALHEDMFFILLDYFSKRMFDFLILNSRPSLIHTFFYLGDPGKNENEFKLSLKINNMLYNHTFLGSRPRNKSGTNIILIRDENCRQLYIERMINDWRQGYVRYVFQNYNIMHVAFFDRLNSLLKREKVELTKTVDNVDESTTLIGLCKKYFTDSNNGYEMYVRWLVDNGADVNESNTNGETPLITCSFKGDVAMVRVLLSLGANINQFQNDSVTPLLAACINRHSDVVQELLKSTAIIPDRCMGDGNSPLHIACEKGLLEIVKHLCSEANVNLINKVGKTPLHLACIERHLKIVCKLMKHEYIDTDICDNFKYTPLHYACIHGHLKIVRELLKNFANHKLCGPTGETALHIACFKGHLDIVKVLLEYEGCINKGDNLGKTPLFIACREGYIDILCELLRHKANIDLCTIHKFTPLHVASERGNLFVVTKLLEHGADFNICSDNKESALYLAFRNGHAEIVKILLHYKANVKAITL